MRVVFDGSEPWFDGHFPGMPVLPAVAHLDLVDRLLRETGDALRGVERARFRRAVLPGEPLDVVVEPGSVRGLARFVVRVGPSVASDGVVRVGPALPSGTIVAEEPGGNFASDIESRIPHRGAMRLLEGVLDEGRCVACLARIGPMHASGGLAPVVLGLEAIAQAGAVSGGPIRGWLVSVVDAVFEVGALPAGAPLVVTARPMPSAPPLALFEGTVAAGRRELVRARLGVMRAATTP